MNEFKSGRGAGRRRRRRKEVWGIFPFHRIQIKKLNSNSGIKNIVALWGIFKFLNGGMGTIKNFLNLSKHHIVNVTLEFNPFAFFTIYNLNFIYHM